MMEWLYAIDVAVFQFLNQTLATHIGDIVWPVLTDYDRQWPIRILLIGTWLWLLIKGGKRGRTAAIMLIPLLVLSDQTSSSLIKSAVARIRPCKALDPSQVHLLVGCGGGFSFPSSHAVNNFAVATMFSRYFPKAKVALYSFASLVALSRVFVGVHYPSDILGGAIIGTFIGFVVVIVWRWIAQKFFPRLAVGEASA